MPKSVTGSSTPKRSKPVAPRLSEVARELVIPEGIATTAWPRVVAKCAEMGVAFDSWQHGIGAIALGKRKNGKYAATVGGVVLSIPRQVGKTFLVGMIIIALCVLTPGFKVLWTAHRTRTSSMTFASLQAMVRKKKIWPHVRAIRTANGEQEIHFTNGSVIMFGAREQGFGRGFDQVDAEVFDEAQILTAKALEDMVPAANASKQASGALLFFMGTPPRPADPGEEFSNRRSKALSGKSKDMVYVELSADPDADPDDLEQVAKANPSFPHRTPVESILRMRENLTDDDSFKREALGIWDEDGGDPPPIPREKWNELALDDVPKDWPLASIGLDMNPERTRVTIAVAAFSDDGVHLELAEDSAFSEAGSQALVDWVFERSKRRVPVVIDAYSPARSFEPELKRRGCLVRVMGAAELSQACGGIYDAAMQDKTISHFGQKALDDSLAGATKENFGPAGAWKWNRKSLDVDLSPLMAATAAHFGAVKFAKKPRPDGAGKQKVVIL